MLEEVIFPDSHVCGHAHISFCFSCIHYPDSDQTDGSHAKHKTIIMYTKNMKKKTRQRRVMV